MSFREVDSGRGSGYGVGEDGDLFGVGVKL